MSITLVRKSQIRPLNIIRSDINTTTSGSALITKVIAGTGLALSSSTGVNPGTGDVTIALSIATASVLGGVKIGSGLTVAVDGTISVSSVSTTWGSITGLLSNQTDLQAALNAKYNNPTGTTSQYIDGTGAYQTFPSALSTGYVRHEVKAGVAINKGQAVYVTGADGTNMIVGLASNATEATSSKTMGLMESTVAINGKANVVTEGLLAGLNTVGANAGDPVWLGTGGNLIFGLATKPYAPKHLVFIGIVTRVNANNGEIFVHVQNGFELDELHDVDLKSTLPLNGHLLGYNGTLWVNKTIAGWLGYTPQDAATAITTSNIGSQSVNYANSAGSATVAGYVNNQSGQLFSYDNRVIAPADTIEGYLQFGFTSWRNDGGGPYADYLHMRSYTDPSGGTDNLIMFLKSGIGMRIWQQSWGSSSPYAEYVDVWTTGDFTQTNVNNWNTAYSWGNHATQSYATQTYVNTAIANLIDSAPGTLDTLNELAAALGDDPNFATTVTNSIAGKVSKSGDTMTGNLNWAQTDRGLTWGMNTDGAYIKFFNTGDGDGDSRLEYATSDNGDEYHRWVISNVERMNLRTEGLNVNGVIYSSGYGNSTEWYTAYTWGNHAGLYALAGHTHTFASITSKPTTIAGYGITNAYTDTQIQNFFNGANAITGYNKSNWDTAYSWGNHASAGYRVNSITNTAYVYATSYRTENYDFTLDPRLSIDSMSIKLWDNYFNNSGLGVDYGSLLDIYGRGGHVHSQFYMDASNALYYRSSPYSGGWNPWQQIWTSGTLTNLNQLVNGPGYITGYTETDTLSSVTARGSSTSSTLNLDGRVNIGNNLVRPAALNSDAVAHARIGGSDVHLYVASLGAGGGYKIAVQAARYSDFQSFDLDLQSNGGSLLYGGNQVATRTWVSSQGYLTSYTETDTLASVTGRGAATNTASIFRGGLYGQKAQVAGNYTTAALWTESYDNTTTGIAFHINGNVGKFLEMRTDGILYWEDRQVWTAGNLTNLNQLSNGPGYITGYTETDTLQSVTSRGSSTNTDISIGGAGGDRGIVINYGAGVVDYGRIRFYQDGSNRSTIHSFSTSWQNGDVFVSTGAINIVGDTGVTFGSWNVPDVVFRTGGISYFRNNVGFGTTNPTSPVEIINTGSAGGGYSMYSTTYAVGKQWGMRKYGIDNGQGIHWSSDVQFSSTWYNAIRIGHGQNSTNPSFQSYYTTYLATTGGNVGVGTTTPQVLLDVNGHIGVVGSNYIYFGHTTTNIGTWSTRIYASGSTHKFNAVQFVFNDEGYGSYEHMRLTYTGLNLNGKQTIDSTDSWLRLNQAGDYGSGVYTPGILRSDGLLINYGGGRLYAGLIVEGETKLGSGAFKVSTDQSFSTIGSYSFRDAVSIWNPNSLSAADTVTVMSIGSMSNGVSLVTTGQIIASGGNSGNWNTAYSWGNHAGLYASINHTHIITAISETAVPPAGISIQAGPGSGNAQGWAHPYGTRLSAIVSGGRSFEIMSTTYPNGELVMRTLDGPNIWDEWKIMLDANNYSSYAATRTGGNTSGTWPISITGNAASATTATTAGALSSMNISQFTNNSGYITSSALGSYLPLSGGTLSGALNMTSELAFRDGAGSFSNIIRAAAYPSEGYPDGVNYWLEYQSKGGHHFVLNTDGGVGGGANPMDDFIVWQGAIDGDRLLELSNVGDLTISGRYTEQSSLRYKENIINLESITEKVDRLRPVRYNKIGNTNTEIGLIAEEVAEVFPEFVNYNAKGEVESLNYTRLSVVLLQTVKELSDKINKLETK